MYVVSLSEGSLECITRDILYVEHQHAFCNATQSNFIGFSFANNAHHLDNILPLTTIYTSNNDIPFNLELLIF